MFMSLSAALILTLSGYCSAGSCAFYISVGEDKISPGAQPSACDQLEYRDSTEHPGKQTTAGAANTDISVSAHLVHNYCYTVHMYIFTCKLYFLK